MKIQDFFSKLHIDETKLLEALADTIFDGIIITDSKGTILFVNKSCEKILGLMKVQLLDVGFDKIINDKELIYSIKDGIKPIEKKTLINDKPIYFRSTPYFIDDKRVFNIIVIKDIANEMDSQYKLKELKDSMEMIKDILDHAYQGIVLVDENGRIVKFNYERLLGIKEEDVLGKPVEEVIENTRLHIVVKTGEKELCEVQKIQGHDMIASRTPIMKDGKIIGAVGTVLFKDIKEVKSLAQRIEVLESKFDRYRGEIKMIREARYSFDNIITQNKQMEHLKDVAKRAAESNSTVLIIGESGTGKEYFAHAIHKASYRKYGAFVRINCAAIPRELLEAELFGYEEGAFTGAKKEGKPGKFELANGGTILLDEIGTLPLDMQAKLLRVLEEREFERIGGTSRIDLDIRVIASTNEYLEDAVKKGKFRQDLYYRLNVIRLNIPPLRDRIDDIPILSEYLLHDLIKKLHMEYKEISPETIKVLKEHNWPGNVRELRNVIEVALNLSNGKVILPQHLPEHLIKNSITNTKTINGQKMLKDIVAEAEIKAIKEALADCDGNRTLAAKKLGIHRTALYKKIESYGLDITEL
ncbi:sigma 54-interacting transcriptional regulator [Brassicibacter mesophilus]|uniref:sigma 54-interacting transcriptional regulator n=1 Tax=Brassicibacter mesophilus TaxID=745119 RepID=UPI003D1AD164